MSARPFLVLALLPFLSGTCEAPGHSDRAGSPATRAALFDLVSAWTLIREARSPAKEAALAVNVEHDMGRLRDTVIGAQTEEDLFYALSRVSNVRRDGHLQVRPVPGGLRPAVPPGAPDANPRFAPLEIHPDFSNWPNPAFFVASAHDSLGIKPGTSVLSVFDDSVGAYVNRVTPFIAHSTRENLMWRIAELMTLQSSTIPPQLQAAELHLNLAGHSVQVPYSLAEQPLRREDPARHYPGALTELSRASFDLMTRDSLVILKWRGFGDKFPEDLQYLMEFAGDEDLLDHTVVLDVTESTGGRGSVELLRRLTGREFIATWSTLRVSDVRPRHLSAELSEWLEVSYGGASIGEIVGPVPFKLRHAGADSLLTVTPSPERFRGGLVVISGSRAGSQVDQLVAMVADNGLGRVVGMPTGGFSNSWEWHETLLWPGTSDPVVEYGWSIGHTLRPDGSILEGNPAQPDVYLAYTAQNHKTYLQQALELALQPLPEQD
ncbi:MAG: hypothetical protein JJ896_10865 [Rhodothermales bacterium]|nr:hypothetical protein [Rhodothermales bacterium]MBO6780143.1 hypothetical protein [Rhodothermales bacterium]